MATTDPQVIAVSAIEMDPRPRILNVDIGARQGLLLTYSPTDLYPSPGHLQLPCLLSCLTLVEARFLPIIPMSPIPIAPL